MEIVSVHGEIREMLGKTSLFLRTLKYFLQNWTAAVWTEHRNAACLMFRFEF